MNTFKSVINSEIEKALEEINCIDFKKFICEREYYVVNFVYDNELVNVNNKKEEIDRIILFYELSLFYSDVRRMYNLSKLTSCNIFSGITAKNISNFTGLFIAYINNELVNMLSYKENVPLLIRNISSAFGLNNRISKEMEELQMYKQEINFTNAIVNVNEGVFDKLIEMLKNCGFINSEEDCLDVFSREFSNIVSYKLVDKIANTNECKRVLKELIKKFEDKYGKIIGE